MPARTHGPLLEDYVRALKAAKRQGAKSVIAVIGGTPIVIPLDDNYLEKLAPVLPPAPNLDSGEQNQDQAPAKSKLNFSW
jgi:hypothetical protein